jgi:hypothetical protein
MSADRRRPRKAAPRLEPLEGRLAPAGGGSFVIDGIQGEAKDRDFAGQIDIYTWSRGEANPGSFAEGRAAGRDRIDMDDFHFTMPVSQASPSLFRSGGRSLG